jgi:hypothetical protein
MVRAGIEVGLPGLLFKVDDIKVDFSRAPKIGVGPFLIMNRTCGLALDGESTLDGGKNLSVHQVTARPRQLWYVRPSGVKGQVLVVNAENNMAMDARPDEHGDIHPTMWTQHREPWQRWVLEESSDGAAFFLATVHDRKRRFLTMSGEAAAGWSPWFEERLERQGQQWVLAQPVGTKSR